MKSLYYVAAVTRVYRAALDAWRADPQGYRVDPAWRRELEAVSHRPYGTGFLFADNGAFVHAADSLYRRECDFVGVVRGEGARGRRVVEGRNRIQPGDHLEIIGPGMRCTELCFNEAHSGQGEPLSIVQPNALVEIALPEEVQAGDLLRRWREPPR